MKKTYNMVLHNWMDQSLDWYISQLLVGCKQALLLKRKLGQKWDDLKYSVCMHPWEEDAQHFNGFPSDTGMGNADVCYDSFFFLNSIPYLVSIKCSAIIE
jgi:hypothetical protein